MWIPKWERDRKKGVDSPVPTQAVSNEEFIPRPQTDKQKQVEHLCERDVDIAEFRRVLEEHLGFRSLK
jgi:hypothetical protein